MINFIFNGDSEISSEELITASRRINADLDVNLVSNPTLLQAQTFMNQGPNDHESIIYKFVQKYWYLVDLDNSGSLSFDEYKYMMAGFAAVDSGLILKVRLDIIFSLLSLQNGVNLNYQLRSSMQIRMVRSMDQNLPTGEELRKKCFSI